MMLKEKPWDVWFAGLKRGTTAEEQERLDTAVTLTTSCYVEYLRAQAAEFEPGSPEETALKEAAFHLLTFGAWEWMGGQVEKWGVGHGKTKQNDAARRSGDAPGEGADGNGSADPPKKPV